MAALGTERSQTQTLPLEEKGAKAPDFQKVYLGGKEVIRSSWFLCYFFLCFVSIFVL